MSAETRAKVSADLATDRCVWDEVGELYQVSGVCIKLGIHCIKSE